MSCRTYLDSAKNGFVLNGMSFSYKTDFNEIKYFSNISGIADNQTFYPTHFSAKVPKKIVYWKNMGNCFFIEYSSKQMISIYVPCKNCKSDSDVLLLDNSNKKSFVPYFDKYFTDRNYDIENLINMRSLDRNFEVISLSGCQLIFFNIKNENFSVFKKLVSESFLVNN
jgi:hypothetical protein